MQVIFNPKDTNTFASASLDKTVKVLLGSAASPLLSRLIYRATLLSCSSLAGCMGLTDSCHTCEPATLLPCSTLAAHRLAGRAEGTCVHCAGVEYRAADPQLHAGGP